MKKILHTIYKGLLAIVATALTCTSCVDDDLMGNKAEVVEGEPITISLNLSGTKTSDIVIETKAGGSNFSTIYDLVIFIFHEDGTFEDVVTNYHDITTLTINSDEIKNNSHLYNVTFETTSGTKKLLAVANVAEGGYWDRVIDILTVAYQNKSNFEEVKSEIVSLREDLTDGVLPFHITASSQMFISGWNENVVFGTNNTVTSYGTYGDQTNEVAVKMYRAMANIVFNIAENPDGAKGTFTPASYRVYNIPAKSYLINDLQGGTSYSLTKNVTGVDYINTASENIGTAQGGNYTFDFYMPENVQTAGSSTTYNQRDTWGGDSGASPEKKIWTNAPQNSTFVVISGTYEGNATIDGTSGQPVTANVEYTIHLGDFGESGENDRNYGDFSVMRNYSYTYNVKVLGVNNIIVEAQKDGGEQQGAEGSVYDNAHTVYSYNLDAHYEQVYLEYNLSDIASSLTGTYSDEELDNAIANQLILIIQSEAMDYTHEETENEPYTTRNKRGTLSPYKIYADAVRNGTDAAVAKAAVLDGAATGVEPTKGFDYKWIEFLPQEGTGISKYPGISSWAKEDLTDMTNQEFYAGATGQTSNNGDPTKLIDVYDMIVEMGKAIKQIYNNNAMPSSDKIEISQNDGNYVARFTAFVNEYYYLRHPLTGMKATSWSVMTNKIPREMIIAMSTETSDDGNSSYSKIHSYISQLAMQTFYNDRVSSLNAFGIETYNETPLSIAFGTPVPITGLTDTDGRENQKILIGASSSPQWDSYINYQNNGWTASIGTTDRSKHKLNAYAYNVQAAYSACMSRNRDLNGNGQIDENEIRWFLPSINEYIRMGIGANAISSAAQLYMGDKSSMTASGYATDYISDGALYFTSSPADKRVFWAVEKGAYSVDGVDYVGYSEGKPIRCIRVLPATDAKTDISSINGVKSDATYIAYEKTTSRPKLLKFKDRLVLSLYRRRASLSLAIHNEDDNANSFYEGIFVANDYLKEKNWPYDYVYYSFEALLGINRISLYNPCESYEENGFEKWRLPNLVELSAMNAAGWLNDCQADGTSNPNRNVASCTQFSNQNVRLGFVRTNGIGCYTNNAQIRVRCVRDVPDNYTFPTN